MVTDWSRAAEHHSEHVGCRPVVLCHQVLAHAHRDRDIGVPEALGDDLHRLPRPQHQRRRRVPGV